MPGSTSLWLPSRASNENTTGGDASWLLRLGHKRWRDFYPALSLDHTILEGVRGQATAKQSQGGGIVERPPKDSDACLAVPGSSFSHLPSPSTGRGNEEAFERTPASATLSQNYPAEPSWSPKPSEIVGMRADWRHQVWVVCYAAVYKCNMSRTFSSFCSIAPLPESSWASSDSLSIAYFLKLPSSLRSFPFPWISHFPVRVQGNGRDCWEPTHQPSVLLMEWRCIRVSGTPAPGEERYSPNQHRDLIPVAIDYFVGWAFLLVVADEQKGEVSLPI